MRRLVSWFKALSAGGKAGVILAAFIGIGIVGAASQPNNSNPTKPASPKTSTVTKPSIVTKTSITTKPVAFTSTTVQDATLAKGTAKVTTQGVNGVETLSYKDTYTNGKLTDHNLTSDEVTTKPVTQVTSVGTYIAPPPPSCTPLTNGGNCYEPGEYCRNSDHGTSGIAGNGESITCMDNNGWRWEPN